MASNEARLVTNIVAGMLRRWPDMWVFKVVGHPYQMSGVPDLLVCVEGLLVGLEVKHQKPGESLHAARNRATPVQRAQIKAINRAGGMAGVVTSVEEAIELVERGLLYREANQGEGS